MIAILTHVNGEFEIIRTRSSLKPLYSFRLHGRKSINAYNSIASERSWNLQTRTGSSTEVLKN